MGWPPILKFQALAFSGLNTIRDVFVRTENLATGAAASEARTDHLASFRREACAASVAQGTLVRAWRMLCSKQRKRGPSVEVYSRSSRQLDGLTGAEVQGKFVEVLMAWFHKRGVINLKFDVASQLSSTVTESVTEWGGQWLRFEYDHRAVKDIPMLQNADKSYHGTWWYAISSILRSGVLLSSNDRNKGHEFSIAGIYSSPHLSTALQYSRAIDLLGMDILFAVVVEMSSNPVVRRQKGGLQYITSEREPVLLEAVLVQVGRQLNVAYGNEEFVPIYDLLLEAGAPMQKPAAASVRTATPSCVGDAPQKRRKLDLDRPKSRETRLGHSDRFRSRSPAQHLPVRGYHREDKHKPVPEQHSRSHVLARSSCAGSRCQRERSKSSPPARVRNPSSLPRGLARRQDETMESTPVRHRPHKSRSRGATSFVRSKTFLKDLVRMQCEAARMMSRRSRDESLD